MAAWSRAYGRTPGPWQCPAHAPVAASFGSGCALERRCGSEKRAGACSDGDETERTGGGLDRGRHGLVEERNAFGRGGASVLWTSGQAGQLPGGGELIGCDPSGQSSHRVAFIPAGELGQRPETAKVNRCSRRD